jgi:ribosomal protein S6--L-glutamate ligase
MVKSVSQPVNSLRFSLSKKPVIGILRDPEFRKKSGTDADRMLQEAKKQGYDVKLFYTDDFALLADKTGLSIGYKGKKLDSLPFDILLPRIANGLSDATYLLLKQFEIMNIPMLNNLASIYNSENKFITHQVFAQHKLPQPKSLYSPKPKHPQLLDTLQGNDLLVLKGLTGYKGDSVQFLNRHAVTQQLSDTNFVQERSKGPAAQDYRYFVIDGQVVSAMKRTATKAGELRSNWGQGGKVEPVAIDPEMAKLAVQATKALKLDMSGVDIMETPEGPILIEINSSPGIQAQEMGSGENIATLVLNTLKNKFNRIKNETK